ncbi:hypothetical protein GCM10009628_25660 [Paeniglutamicibacter kerguelensis]
MISDSVKLAEETVNFEAAAEPPEVSGAAVGSEQPLRINDPATTERATRRGNLLLFVMVSLNSSREILQEHLSRFRPEGESHSTIVAYYAGHKQYLIFQVAPLGAYASPCVTVKPQSTPRPTGRFPRVSDRPGDLPAQEPENHANPPHRHSPDPRTPTDPARRP